MIYERLGSVLREVVSLKLLVGCYSRPRVFCWGSWEGERGEPVVLTRLQRRASTPGRPRLRPGPAGAVSRCPQVGVWETAAASPSSLKIKCSSSFTVEPGNIGRPVTIS